MFSIVYTSEARPECTFPVMEAMLIKARRYNMSHHITGCILFYEGTFLQYLEGAQWEVIHLYDRISRDLRHENIKLLSHCRIEQREFRKWNQAYENPFGANAMLNYIRLIVSDSVDQKSCPLPTNETSSIFWGQARKILHRKPV